MVVCSRDVGAVFIKGFFYQQTLSSLYYSSQSTGKVMQIQGFQKSITVEAKIFHQLCDKAALKRQTTNLLLQCLTVSSTFGAKIEIVCFIVKFYKLFSQ